MAMRVSVLLRTSEYRGDHDAEITTAHEVLPGETVEQLAERLLVPSCSCDKIPDSVIVCDHARGDFVELRLVRLGR